MSLVWSSMSCHACRSSSKVQQPDVRMLCAGDATSFNAWASLSLVVGLESTSISLAVTPKFLKPLYNASHIVALQFGGPGPSSKAGYTVVVDYKDGTTETAVTDINGQAVLVHGYIRFSNPAFIIAASFAGKAAVLHASCA